MRTRQARLRVRVFLRVSILIDPFPRALRAVHGAIWLGILEGRDLNDVTAACYESASGFETENHNLGGLWPWEESQFSRIFANCQSLLVAAAGGGREAIALAKEGFEVAAFDSSEGLTIACRDNMAKAGVKGIVLLSEPDQVPSNLGIYGGLVVGRGAYHHIPGRRRRIRFLKRCREHLSLDAPLFLGDFQYHQIVSRGVRMKTWIAGLVRKIRCSQEPIEIGDELNAHNFYHRFQRDEIEAELHEAGFQLEDFAESPFGEGENLAHCVARSAKQHAQQTEEFK